MNNRIQGTADREINRAIIADEQANAHYYQILKRFISGNSTVTGEELCQPEAKLNADGLKEIDKAWLLLQITAKNLRKSYMKLYTASL
ncbi:hypothetical protein ACFLTJ_02705 [Chloroflexota bacterium]